LQLVRDRLLKVSKADIQRVTEKYLITGRQREQICIVGDGHRIEEKIQLQQNQPNGWNIKSLEFNDGEDASLSTPAETSADTESEILAQQKMIH